MCFDLDVWVFLVVGFMCQNQVQVPSVEVFICGGDHCKT